MKWIDPGGKTSIVARHLAKRGVLVHHGSTLRSIATMIKQNSLRYHPEFDLEFARSVYDLPMEDESLEGELITSPYDLVVVEELRDRRQLRIGKSVPTDIFVFCKGEPENPDCTKVGGRPYWIDDRTWPVDKAKKPLRFLAQFNFVDSKDLFDELPGEVLLLFVGMGNHPDWNQIHFEWLPARQNSITTTDATRMVFPTTAFYGAIYRSADYPEARAHVLAMETYTSHRLPFLSGTKIGGRPSFIQSDDDLEAQPLRVMRNPFRPGTKMRVPGRPSRKGYLCQLASIQPHPSVKYPWANRKTALSVKELHKSDNTILFDDMGSIYVFRSDNGKLWSSFEGY